MMMRTTLRIWRTNNFFADFTVSVPDGSTVIDAIERVFAQPDTGLVWRHACHHASCGSCGIRINGVEKLPCVTPLSDYPEGKSITLQPLKGREPFYERYGFVRCPNGPFGDGMVFAEASPPI